MQEPESKKKRSDGMNLKKKKSSEFYSMENASERKLNVSFNASRRIEKH